MMNKTETKKLASLVAKSKNQCEAVLAFFEAGNTITPEGAKAAGIADPRRIVNLIRESGTSVDRNVMTNRKGNTIVYSLTPKKSKKASKRSLVGAL